MIAAIKNIFRKSVVIPEKPSAEAYDIWAENYDTQPGNLMLDFDEAIFTELLADINIINKNIADIGCGTGRHWPKLFGQNPYSLTGFDVSAGMLAKLKNKYPQAHTHHITDNLFTDIPNASFDTIVSTLTAAHIENIEEALVSWSRMLKPRADIIITDFHPTALAKGGKRTFEHNKGHMAVENFIHPVEEILRKLEKQGFELVTKVQKMVDESVKHYYSAKNALHVYKDFEHCPIIYGIHLNRS